MCALLPTLEECMADPKPIPNHTKDPNYPK
jgi:hypothetical protein